jgi:SAM-dependent methyltransferase
VNIKQYLRRVSFILWYFRSPPWESGIVPPEVEHFIREIPPGRALDLGCGSGTSSLALARAGWKVTGVDFAPQAIRIARRKAKAAGLNLDLRIGEVARLHGDLLSASFDLVLDIGCFHALEPDQKQDYLAALPRLLAPGGTWLLYGFPSSSGTAGVGLREEDIQTACRILEFAWRQDGWDVQGGKSTWLSFRMERG